MIKSILAVFLFSVSALASGEGHEKNFDANVGYPNKFNPSVAQALNKVALAEPPMNAKVPAGSVTLKWGTTEGADAYHIQVATDLNFKWLVTDKSLVTAESLVVEGLESGKTYFWRVAPMKTSNLPSYLKGPFNVSAFDVQ